MLALDGGPLRRAIRGVLVDALIEVAGRDRHGLFSRERQVAANAAREAIFAAGELLGLDRAEVAEAIAAEADRRTAAEIAVGEGGQMIARSMYLSGCTNRREPNET